MERKTISKTNKLFIGGKFPRTESGRHYAIKGKEGQLLANACLSSRKDFRNAVVAARKSQSGWASATAYNRSQVLYRLAEMLEGRSASMVEEMMQFGYPKKKAQSEVAKCIDRLVYYAGWCDKYTALFGSVNPTASDHFNFSVHEPTGVVACVAPEDSPLLGFISLMAPAIAGGNASVILASRQFAPIALTFAEVIQNSDVPAGLVNILTGELDELLPHMASHMDVNALLMARDVKDKAALQSVIENVKRLVRWSDWDREDPYTILDLQEVKTTWYPVQRSASTSGGY